MEFKFERIGSAHLARGHRHLIPHLWHPRLFIQLHSQLRRRGRLMYNSHAKKTALL